MTASVCVQDASSMNQMWGEEAKTMSGYLDNFNTAKQAVARDPARKLIADGSSSTFAQYWSAALKAHRCSRTPSDLLHQASQFEL